MFAAKQANPSAVGTHCTTTYVLRATKGGLSKRFLTEVKVTQTSDKVSVTISLFKEWACRDL